MRLVQSSRYQVVGNPLRSRIVDIDSSAEKPAGSKRLLVVGGSLGAKVLNDTVPTAINQIKLQNIDVWHQTGKGNQEAVFKSYQSFGLPEEKIKVTDFIDDMAEAYEWADVCCMSSWCIDSFRARYGCKASYIRTSTSCSR